jgi:dipeptidyl aminopeptidase/acylaminoacyl peptidase
VAFSVRIAAATLLVMVGACLAVCGAVARASFPGSNGKLAVTLEGCGDLNQYIDAFDVHGRALGPITAACEPSMAADPELELMRSTRAPEWFADGTRLLYVDDDTQLTTVTADGTDPQALLSRPLRDTVTKQPIALPNGASIAPNGTRVTLDYGGSIWRVDVDPIKVKLLRKAPRCDDGDNCVQLRSPRWSPDGRVIAFESVQFAWGPGRKLRLAEGIWLMNARSGKLIRRVARRGFDIDWAPDGEHLVYRTAYAHEAARGASGGNLYVVRTDGTHRRLLVRRTRLAEIVPKWSPDGRWIAWISLRISAGELSFTVKPSIWRVRASGGRPHFIAKLSRPTVEEGDFLEPELAWQPVSDN